MTKTLEMHIAAATAHRACCGTEHDPLQGKLHGYCVVCGVPWPCDTARYYLKDGGWPNHLPGEVELAQSIAAQNGVRDPYDGFGHTRLCAWIVTRGLRPCDCKPEASCIAPNCNTRCGECIAGPNVYALAVDKGPEVPE